MSWKNKNKRKHLKHLKPFSMKTLAPTIFLQLKSAKEDCPPNISIIQLLTMSGMVKSGKEARRLINDKAVKLEGKLINNISFTYEISDFVDPQKLSIGKKKHFNIIII